MVDETRELKFLFNKQSTEINTLKESLKGAEILADQLNKSVEGFKGFDTLLRMCGNLISDPTEQFSK